MKTKILILSFLLMLIFGSTACAWRSTPYSYGIVVNNNLTVVGVNINGPAYQSGIRPGDIITNVTKEQLYTTDESTLSISYKRDDQSINTTLTSKKLLDISEMTTFLILDSSKANYDRLVKLLAFNSSISPMFPIQNADNNIKIINTSSVVTRKNVNNFPDYLVAVGGSGFGFTNLRTQGSFALADAADNDSLLKISLGFQASFGYIGGTAWDTFPSSGILERNIVDCLYSN